MLLTCCTGDGPEREPYVKPFSHARDVSLRLAPQLPDGLLWHLVHTLMSPSGSIVKTSATIRSKMQFVQYFGLITTSIFF